MIEDEGKKMPNKKKKYTSKRARVERNRLIFIISVVVVICIAVILAIIFWNPDKSGEGGDSSLSSEVSVSSIDSSTESEESVSSEESVPSEVTSSESETSESSSSSSSASSSSKPSSSSVPVTELGGDWKLILANPTHKLPDDFSIEEAPIQGYTMDARAVGPAKEMIAAAKADGIDLLVCSAYRPISSQQNLFDRKVQEYLNQGYSQSEAEKIAATIVAIPGTSEHQTGLALDIVTPSYQSLDDGYADTAAAKWLKANAADYGFILRFPKDKEDITKIIFEPWHYRYVGVDAAKEIMSKGITLEEYLGEVD